MLMLLATVVLGITFAIFATQNTQVVTLNFGKYILPNIPIYLVVLTPLLIGLFVSFIINTANNLFSLLNVSEKTDRIRKLKNELAEITKRAHKLELENTRLKAKNGEFDEDSI